MKIGFLDSGIGGFTVLKEALNILPNEDYLYFADTLHTPYGTKPKEEVKRYILEAVDFIDRQGIKALVIACNTATIVAVNEVRERYGFPVIGMEPAVKPAVEENRNRSKRVLVLATPLALKEEKFLNLLTRVDSEHKVDLLPAPKLVEFAEKFVFDDTAVLQYLKEILSEYELNQYGTMVLGCTHFPFFKEAIKKLIPEHIHIIDGSAGTVKRLKSILEEKGLINSKETEGIIDFYFGGKKEDNKDTLSRYMKLLKL